MIEKSARSHTIHMTKKLKFSCETNGILLPKLFWPTVRKNCSSDREKLLKFEAFSGKLNLEFYKQNQTSKSVVHCQRGNYIHILYVT